MHSVLWTHVQHGPLWYRLNPLGTDGRQSTNLVLRGEHFTMVQSPSGVVLSYVGLQSAWIWYCNSTPSSISSEGADAGHVLRRGPQQKERFVHTTLSSVALLAMFMFRLMFRGSWTCWSASIVFWKRESQRHSGSTSMCRVLVCSTGRWL